MVKMITISEGLEMERKRNPQIPWQRLREICQVELGYALLYMNYYHPEFKQDAQYGRVDELCQRFAVMYSTVEGCGVWDRFLKEIKDEIENMC
jgi:hypothetical protein